MILSNKYWIIFTKMLSVSIAFIVFGLIDNGLMILAGSWIDSTIATTFELSTMASAALGNTFSDGIGIMCGRCVENFIYNYIPKVKDDELNETLETTAEMIGIILGCLLGMCLLFLI